MEQVLGDTGALGLPIQPDAPGAVMDVVAPVHHVDGGVHLDAADLRAGEVLLVIDVVDVVVLDKGEHPAQMAHNAGLATVVDIAPADDVVPMFSLVQPWIWARQMHSRSVWVPSLYFLWSHLLSFSGW